MSRPLSAIVKPKELIFARNLPAFNQTNNFPSGRVDTSKAGGDIGDYGKAVQFAGRDCDNPEVDQHWHRRAAKE